MHPPTPLRQQSQHDCWSTCDLPSIANTYDIRILISLFPMLASFANVGEDFHIKALTSINRDG
jgi:hypothetical protein